MIHAQPPLATDLTRDACKGRHPELFNRVSNSLVLSGLYQADADSGQKTK